MQPVFVRHNCSSTSEVLRQLWNERLIALHYEDIFSVLPSDYYPAGRKALERLWKYCKSGAIVGANYSRLDGSRMLVGKIIPGSDVIAKEFIDPETGAKFIYKTVHLENSRIIRYSDYPLLVGVQPRQATITGWPSAKQVLTAALMNNALPRQPSNLHPSQLEVLCYEWLRTSSNLERLVMPIGRGLIDIDIFGVTATGNRVLAQVTHSVNLTELKDKESRLLQHAGTSDSVFFFLPELNLLPHNAKVKQITFANVLDDLQSSPNKSIKVMLDEMFGKSS